MDIKKLGRVLLFPHIAIMIILIPIAAFLLVYSMVFLTTSSAVSIISYVLSAYTLTVWCFRIPYLIKLWVSFKNENKYARLWQDDTRLRVSITLYVTLIYNTAYALLQLGMGFWHHSFWFCSLSGYHISLAVMRFFLVRHTRGYLPGKNMLSELKKYRACGIILLVMNVTLALIIFFMVYWNRTFNHHEITTIALAAYTFTSLTVAIINTVRYRRYNSPVYSAAKAISLASATVSLLTLESSMLTTFNSGAPDLTCRRIMLAASGVAVSAFIITMAVYMIVKGSEKIKQLSSQKE